MNKGESIEEAARKLRYEALNTVKFDLLATAHHLNDNIETIIINLLRGSGLKGMCGIPIIRDNIIRPLLKLSKKQILKFCNENNLEFVTDSTNESDDYVRNLIRHKIIPVFEKISPSYEKVFSRNIELLKSDEDYISTKACELFKTAKTDKGIDISCLENIHTSLLTRVVRMFTVEVTGITPDLFHIERFAHLIAKKSGNYDLAKGYIAKVKNGYFFFEHNKKKEYSVSYSIISREIYNNSLKVNKLLLKNAVDYDKICGEFSIRTRKTGDRLRIKNRGLTKSVRRIQQEKNISVSKRDILPIASDDKGAFWGYLIGTDERVLVDDNTNNVLIFKIEEN
jgi:tRNA(Ile)-lysidine synthase